METTEGSGAARSGSKNAILVILGAAVIGLGAYGIYEHQEKNRYKEDLNKQIVELQQKNDRTSKAIENNLAEISAREGILASPSGKETNLTAEERISNSINAIEGVLKKNKEMIDKLRATVGERDIKLVRFERQMARLDKRLKDYKTQNESLTAQTETLKRDLDEANKMRESISTTLAQKQKELDEKAALVEKQSGEIADKDKALHTAYYTVGTYKELKENNVLDKEGGLIGIGSTARLKSDFDKKQFNKIDIYSYTSIPVFSKNAKIITNHSPDSYELVHGPNGEVQWIKIKDPEKFWENSKYLVVEKRGQPSPATASVNQ